MSKKELPNLNIVIIGHVDSGKSTTCGQLIANLGKIDQRVLDKYAKEANEMGKGSFKWAWVMDNLKAERERGITINNSLNELFTKTKKITIIDAPGHRDFIKNMISGTSQADAAILMVSGAKGEFEAGISENGQTKEHAMLAQTLGIKNFVVCINKMDTTIGLKGKEFDKARFEEIRDYLSDFLVKLNFAKENFTFVPISGFDGDNIAEKSTRCSWYKGPTLAAIMDDIKIPKRPIKKALRLPIQSIFKIAGIGLVASGRVETGVMTPGMQVVIMPLNKKSEVKSIEMHHAPIPKAFPGDNVGFNIKNVEYKSVKKGMVVGDANNNPPKEAKSFTARLLVLNHSGQIRVGYSPVVFVHSAHVTCKISKIQQSFDRRTGKTIEENPDFIKKDMGAIVEFTPERPLVVESFKKFSPLGRFSIRDSKLTVGVGVIMSVDFTEN
ncbi:Ef1a-f2p [Bonamia ostreae]|uniref:Elongation factor 1-alpha n=1 Tax=Bonamia ostreae TaxID=126728 RepID=A0ABV2AJT7_9EUKA